MRHLLRFGTFFIVKLVGLIYAHIALVPYLFLTTQIINSTECETSLLSNNALDLLYSAHCNNLFWNQNVRYRNDFGVHRNTSFGLWSSLQEVIKWSPVEFNHCHQSWLFNSEEGKFIKICMGNYGVVVIFLIALSLDCSDSLPSSAQHGPQIPLNCLFRSQADHQDILYVLFLVIDVIFPKSLLSTYGAHAFSCLGPAVWNCLAECPPTDLSLSLDIFRWYLVFS